MSNSNVFRRLSGMVMVPSTGPAISSGLDPQMDSILAEIGEIPGPELYAVNYLLTNLRAAGILSQFSSIYWGLTASLNLFRCDLMHPGVSAYTLAPVNSPMEPPFFSYQGYADDGTGRGWTNSAELGTHYPEYTQNSSHMSGLWTAGARSNTASLGFAGTAPGAYIVPHRSSTGTTRAQYNDGTTGDVSGAVLLSHVMIQRRASNDRRLFRNGVQAAAGTTASTGLPTGGFKLLWGIGASAVNQTIAVATLGGPLTDKEAVFSTILDEAVALLNLAIGPQIRLQEPSNGPNGSLSTYPSRVFTGGAVDFKGTMEISEDTNVQGKIVDESDATVKDYTTVDGGGTGDWSGQLTSVPDGGPYYGLARAEDGTAQTPRSQYPFYVGYNWLRSGESIQAFHWREWTFALATPGNTFRFTGDRVMGWPETDDPVIDFDNRRNDGEASCHFANLMSTYSGGAPIGDIQAAWPGTKLEHWLEGGTAWPGTPYSGNNMADWQKAVVNSEVTTGEGPRGAPGKAHINGIFMTEGINDATDTPTTDYATMLANWEQWLAEVRAYFGWTIPIGIPIMGRCLVGDPEVIDGVRRATLQFCEDNAANEVYVACSLGPLGVVDDYHHNSLGRRDMAAWQARTAAFWEGWATSTGCGPKLTGLTVTGNAFTATVTHNTDGTTLEDKSGSASGSVTGFEIEVDGTARTITACTLSSGTIVGTFDGAAKVTSARIRYQYAGDFDVTNPVYDDVVCDGASTGRPLLPTNGWVDE